MGRDKPAPSAPAKMLPFPASFQRGRGQGDGGSLPLEDPDHTTSHRESGVNQMEDTRLMNNRRVLVSGSDTGIGRGVALEFAREGAAVVLHYSRDESGARSAVDEIRAAGGRAEAFHADFNDVGQVRALAAQAIDFLGGLDVLVNNAGITMN